MANSLKQYVIIGFNTEKEARNALNSTIEFFRSGSTNSDDLSRCEGNIVYFRVETLDEKALLENYLLNQPGAQPKGCLCKE